MSTNLLNDKDVMINREFALIQFYKRVLAQAVDQSIPLLERLSYLCIVSKNCDELFEVRVARLLKWDKYNPSKVLPDGLSASEALTKARDAFESLYNEIYFVYREVITPALAQEQIFILNPRLWTRDQYQWVHNYFMTELKPVLTPIGIDPAQPFPRVPNKSLHFAVALEGADQFGRESKIAIVEAPRILPRVIKFPTELSAGVDAFILLQDIIKLHVNEFFYGMNVCGCYPFRVTRSAELTVKSNQENLRSAVTESLNKRVTAQCSRLELDISDGKPDVKFIEILLKQFNLTTKDLYLATGPVNLSRLLDIVSLVNRKELLFPNFKPGMPKELIGSEDLFKSIRRSDILIHTPYQSFDPVVELTRLAAEDPDVLAVKMTVYRTGQDSELANNLIKAAKLGKQVVASVELFARFDEEANVEFAHKLEEAGAHVVYGVMGYKVHSKMLLIVRKEKSGLNYYVHLGTGNYHQSTTKAYTDFGILTSNPDIARDVDNIFAQITGVGRAGMLKLLYQAPFTLHDLIIKSIEREIFNALNGNRAEIIAKMNSLMDNQVIHTLYRASQAGVKINLIVRGACALRPQVSGISDNIHVRSIVGRFLEHHRVFYFYNAGNEDLYISSADWMKRNFFKRVETCVPILDSKIKRRIINEGLKLYLQDNTESWALQSDGTYVRIHDKRKKKISAQTTLITQLAEPSEYLAANMPGLVMANAVKIKKENS